VQGPPVVVPPAQFPAASAFAPSLGTPVSGSAWDGSPVGNGEIPQNPRNGSLNGKNHPSTWGVPQQTIDDTGGTPWDPQ
jgi:hypothetical protein